VATGPGLTAVTAHVLLWRHPPAAPAPPPAAPGRLPGRCSSRCQGGGLPWRGGRPPAPPPTHPNCPGGLQGQGHSPSLSSVPCHGHQQVGPCHHSHPPWGPHTHALGRPHTHPCHQAPPHVPGHHLAAHWGRPGGSPPPAPCWQGRHHSGGAGGGAAPRAAPRARPRALHHALGPALGPAAARPPPAAAPAHTSTQHHHQQQQQQAVLGHVTGAWCSCQRRSRLQGICQGCTSLCCWDCLHQQ